MNKIEELILKSNWWILHNLKTEDKIQHDKRYDIMEEIEELFLDNKKDTLVSDKEING